MRFKLLVLCILCITFSLNTFAKAVDKNIAEKVAINFFYERSNQFGHNVDFNSIKVIDIQLVDQSYWIVNLQQGWVVVAGDDVMTPVIGYNYSGDFPSKNQQGYNLRSWMQNFSDQVDFINANHLQADENTIRTWQKYETDDLALLNTRSVDNEVEPLTTSIWNQPNPYNALCPEDEAGPGGNALTGCVATAMAQIMYYWRYPIHGSGQHSYYSSNYGTISANFGDATYNWDAMQDAADPSNYWETAEISFHAGVGVNMDYGPDASGAQSSTVPYALYTYFNYSNSAQYLQKSSYLITAWEAMLQSELDAGHPLYYSGYSNEGGHAFVFDGYQGDNYYHINLGWGGAENGYYTLQDVAGFNSGQGMVRYIIPDDPDYPYYADGDSVLTEFSGSFTDGSGPVNDYPSGTEASWLIDPQTDVDSVEQIKLEFKEFNTKASDYVRVYGGNSTDDELLGEFSGSDIPDMISWDGNQMLITFSSSGSAPGFRAEYEAIFPTYCSGTQTFTEPYGTITDGSGDFNYKNSTNCILVIQNPEAVKITLEFTDFETEPDNDVLQVYNEDYQLLGEFSGNELPPAISEETGALYLIWSTSSEINAPGWSAEYYIDGVGIQENTPFNKFVIYPNPTDGMLNLNLDTEKKGDIEIRITNMSGQQVYDEKIIGINGTLNKSIDIKEQPKGIYLFSLITDKGKFDKKIVLN